MARNIRVVGEKQKKPVVAWWSGGITSAVACYLALKKYGSECEVVFIDTRNEHPDTYRFLRDCAQWYGVEIRTIYREDYKGPSGIWDKYQALVHARGAICSTMLKREVREWFQDTDGTKAQIFGFETGKKEERRAENMRMNYPEIRPEFPLIEAGLSKKDCLNMAQDAGVRPPKMYELGYSNNNCYSSGCVQGGMSYWWKVKTDNPQAFHAMAAREHKYSLAQGRPVTMLRDRAGGKSRPLFLKHCPDFPEVGHLEQKAPFREIESLLECNGFCATE